jgi:DNA polymerase-1
MRQCRPHFKKPPAEVTSQERNIGKTVNFGILYGISAHGLAEDLAISRAAGGKNT